MSHVTDRWVPGRRLGSAAAPTSAPSPSEGVRSDWFEGLDLSGLTDAALSAALESGSEHADIRITNTDAAYAMARDATPSGASTAKDRGMAVRVLVDGRWGFAAGDLLTATDAAHLARKAAAMARVSASLGSQRVELAPEPAHRGWWASAAAIDPFEVSAEDRMALLIDRCAALQHHAGVDHTEGEAHAVRERVHYADVAGTFLQQQRIRVQAEWSAVSVSDGAFESMRTLAPPVGRGWEYVLGTATPVGPAPGWDFDEELAALPELLAQKAAAPGIEPGQYTLLLDPTHLWLTIHESVGHATELDRALGYEANYAGTSFATPDQLGTLQYGSPLMRVTGDRVAPHGLSTAAFDDEGVAAQTWDIIRGGRLVDYQLDRAMAAEFGRMRSNGCAHADSFAHVPIQRMPNVSLQPGTGDTTLDDLVADIEDGIMILGDNSWSIDMQRYNFQFTGQRFWRIRDGAVVGQVKDVAYQSSTLSFWRSLSAVGGLRSMMLGGAFNCGKGQPGQVAAVSHGAPAARFDAIRVLNTTGEAGR
jgi:TldD protein